MICAGCIPSMLLVAFPGVVVAADDLAARRSCIAENVALTDIEFEDVGYGQWQFYADVTNDLDGAISGLRVSFRLKAPERAVPWLADDATQSIPGGVEPGETRDGIFITNTSVPRDTPTDVVLEMTVVDVADADGNQFVNDVTIIGGNWTNEMTSLECTQ